MTKATFQQYCVWKRCVSDNEPTQEEFASIGVGDLMTIASEAERIERTRSKCDRKNSRRTK